MLGVRETVHERVARGRWKRLRVWKSEDDYQAYRSGQIVLPIWSAKVNNGITDEGIHYLLDTGFRGQAQISVWNGGLIDGAGFSGVNPGDTMASHSGWTENVNYSETNRPTFSFPAAAGRSITDEISFTINAASQTIQGIFVTSDNTKGGTTGTLWSTAEFPQPPVLNNGNVLTASYTLSD